MDNNEISQEIREKVIRIEILLENNAANNTLQIKALSDRVSKLESAMEWVWRAVIGGLITGVFGILITTAQSK